jgi:hypothetical protein
MPLMVMYFPFGSYLLPLTTGGTVQPVFAVSSLPSASNILLVLLAIGGLAQLPTGFRGCLRRRHACKLPIVIHRDN